MVEAPRQRPVEHYNPRPLILGVCFFWGIAAGFLLFYLSPPIERPAPPPPAPPPEVQPTPERPDRFAGAPTITDIASGTMQPATRPRTTLETMELVVPPPALTTEGGLTGRTAGPLHARNGTGTPDARRPPPQPMTAPPPIPELMP